METVDNWKMRDEEDVGADLKKFMEDLRISFQQRVDSSSKPLIEILTYLDLDSIFNFVMWQATPY